MSGPSDYHFPPEKGKFRADPFRDAKGDNPFGEPPSDAKEDANPYSAPMVEGSPYRPTGFESIHPHRGEMWLSLGILSLFLSLFSVLTIFCCLPLGLAVMGISLPVWILSSKDLQAMRAGAMDPTGRTMTRAGQVTAILATLISASSTAGIVAIWFSAMQ